MFNSVVEKNEMKCSLEALVSSGQLKVASDTDAQQFDRIKNIEISVSEFNQMKDLVKYVGVTEEFKNVIEAVDVEDGVTPAGTRS